MVYILRLRVGGLAVRIPEAVAEEWPVREESAVEIVISGNEVVLRKKTYDLAELLAKVIEEDLHTEQDLGDPQGNEVW